MKIPPLHNPCRVVGKINECSYTRYGYPTKYVYPNRLWGYWHWNSIDTARKKMNDKGFKTYIDWNSIIQIDLLEPQSLNQIYAEGF